MEATEKTFPSGSNNPCLSINLSSERARARPPKKFISSSKISSTNDETAPLLEQISSANTITSLEDTNFMNEPASMEVIQNQQSDRAISRLRGNKDVDVENKDSV